jgi:hypothetical protein
MSFEQIERKIREARFFFDKMIVQEPKAFGNKEPFDFYLSAFLNATRDYFTIDKVERKSCGGVCGEYLLLLERMVAKVQSGSSLIEPRCACDEAA